MKNSTINTNNMNETAREELNIIYTMTDQALKAYIKNMTEQDRSNHEIIIALAHRLKCCNYWEWKKFLQRYLFKPMEALENSFEKKFVDKLFFQFLEINPDYFNDIRSVKLKKTSKKWKNLRDKRLEYHLKKMSNMGSFSSLIRYHLCSPSLLRTGIDNKRIMSTIESYVNEKCNKASFEKESFEAFYDGMTFLLEQDEFYLAPYKCYPESFRRHEKVRQALVRVMAARPVIEYTDFRFLICLIKSDDFKGISQDSAISLIGINPDVMRYCKPMLLNDKQSLGASDEDVNGTFHFFKSAFESIRSKALKDFTIVDAEDVAKYIPRTMRNAARDREIGVCLDKVKKRLVETNGYMICLYSPISRCAHKDLLKIAVRKTPDAINLLQDRDKDLIGKDYYSELLNISKKAKAKKNRNVFTKEGEVAELNASFFSERNRDSDGAKKDEEPAKSQKTSGSDMSYVDVNHFRSLMGLDI